MGAPFLTTTVADMQVAVEVAWGADLTDLDGSGWSWTDITADVLFGNGVDAEQRIRITIGRPDESSETQTAELVCVLDNRTGAYSEGGMSPNWPDIRRGTPVRVRVSDDDGSTWSLRFQGTANGWTPAWDATTGRWATVVLSASGPLRKLNQGTLPAQSVYAQTIPHDTSRYPGLVYYWNNEGGTGMQAVPPSVPVVYAPNQRMLANQVYIPRVVLPANTDAFPFSGPLPGQWANFAGGTGSSPLPATSNTGVLQFRWLSIISSVPSEQPILFFETSADLSVLWTLMLQPDGGIYLKNDDGYAGVAIAFNANNKALMFQLTIATAGSNATATLTSMDQTGARGTFTWSNMPGPTIGYCAFVQFIGPNINDDGETPIVSAHMTVQNQSSSMAAVEDMFLGFPGEATLDRLERLCNGHGFYLAVLDSTATENASVVDTMGPQYYDTLTALLRECEVTGQGVLYDGLGPGLTYVTKQYRQAAAAAATLTLDAAAGEIMEPFAPVDDDQTLRNHVDAVRRNSVTTSHIDRAGPLGAEVVGDYSTSLAVNPEGDGGVIDYARWGVHLGTQQGYRYPSVSFALETNPTLIADWLDCTPQSRIDVVNVGSVRRQHPGNDVRLLLEGWAEEISQFTWRVTANTSRADAWNVVRLAAPTGSTGDDVGRYETSSSQLNTSVSAGATSISVRTNSGPVWVTSSADSDSFPFAIDLGGIRAVVTAISGASSPQTFTLSAALPRAFTGSTSPGAGTPIRLWKPPVLGL